MLLWRLSFQFSKIIHLLSCPNRPPSHGRQLIFQRQSAVRTTRLDRPWSTCTSFRTGQKPSFPDPRDVFISRKVHRGFCPKDCSVVLLWCILLSDLRIRECGFRAYCWGWGLWLNRRFWLKSSRFIDWKKRHLALLNCLGTECKLHFLWIMGLWIRPWSRKLSLWCKRGPNQVFATFWKWVFINWYWNYNDR